MGLKGRTDHPDVQEAMLKLERVIRESNVLLGGVAPTAEQANAMMERGYKALVLGFDWSLLQKGINAVLDGVRRPAR